MWERLTFEREMLDLGLEVEVPSHPSLKPKEPLAVPPSDDKSAAVSIRMSAPRLSKPLETFPPAYTLYVDIPLGSESPAKPMTGIFIPEKYSPQAEVDLIIYLHGYKKDEHEKWYEKLSIDQYWAPKTFPEFYFPLREGINESRKNVILIAPTLGYKSEAGSLKRPGGFDAYLNKVMAALVEYGPYKNLHQSPAFGKIILASHSGGGEPMLQIVMNNDNSAAKIQECWGFDCLYGGKNKKTGEKYYTQPKGWIKWAKSNRNKNLYIYYQGSTEKESKYLEDNTRSDTNIGKISISRSNAKNHFWVPLKHWVERIRKAPLLDRVK